MSKFRNLFIVFVLGVCVGVEGQESLCNSLLTWQCDNGECINIAERCNGVKDCSDGSDETANECISFQCPDTKFKCLYGGCVSKDAECNGKVECPDGSDELTEKCIPDLDKKLQGNCTVEEFQCKSGECVPIEALCNGPADCMDKSDEQVESCASKCCPPFGFRCGYGGCIDEHGKCDDIKDCEDESDENYLLCGYPKGGRPPPSTEAPSTTSPSPIQNGGDWVFPGFQVPGSCQITKIPRNGWIEQIAPPNYKLSYGEYVDSISEVRYRCQNNHLPNGADTNFCFQGEWKFGVPDCEPFCSTKVISGVSIQPVSCYIGDTDVRCTEAAKPGTIARISCRSRYELPGTKQQILTCSENGEWSPQPQVCTATCGEEAPSGTPYIVGGFETNITKVPWHAGIYKRDGNTFQLQCGGTIVNARVIISAMHCFWDRAENKPYPASQFRVAVGKAALDYLSTEDLRAQYFDVERIFYDDGYADVTGNFAADIVMIILKTTIEFQAHIAPICIPYGLAYDDVIVPSGWEGRVAGWGLTESGGKPSPVLKITELPVVDRQTCLANSPITFRPQVTSDKFCAGFAGLGVGVCQGDSGGGLVFPEVINSRTRYNLRGIVSTGPNKAGSCDSDLFTTFTNILYYEKLIQLYETRYRPR